MADNVETMAWRGSPPWHGLGVNFEQDATPEEILGIAGLNWSVSTRPLFTLNDPPARLTQVPDQGTMLVERGQALVRDSDNSILDLVGPRYTPFQNKDVMGFFSGLCKAGKVKMETAGALDGGRWVWALARMERKIILPGDDVTDNFLLMSHPHIFGKAFLMHVTPIRVVCQNTLNMALRSKISDQYRATHRVQFAPSMVSDMERVVGLADKELIEYEDQARLLSSVKWSEREASTYFRNVIGYSSTAKKEILKAANDDDDHVPLNQLQHTPGSLAWLYEYGPGAKLESARETGWGAYNAVTHYMDHEYGNGTQAQRLTNAWYGPNQAIKRKAFDLALEITKARLAA